jgi:hypothetical protein
LQGLLASEQACQSCRMIKKRVGADKQEHDIEGAIVHPDSAEGKARGLQVHAFTLLHLSTPAGPIYWFGCCSTLFAAALQCYS